MKSSCCNVTMWTQKCVVVLGAEKGCACCLEGTYQTNEGCNMWVYTSILFLRISVVFISKLILFAYPTHVEVMTLPTIMGITGVRGSFKCIKKWKPNSLAEKVWQYFKIKERDSSQATISICNADWSLFRDHVFRCLFLEVKFSLFHIFLFFLSFFGCRGPFYHAGFYLHPSHFTDIS